MWLYGVAEVVVCLLGSNRSYKAEQVFNRVLWFHLPSTSPAFEDKVVGQTSLRCH